MIFEQEFEEAFMKALSNIDIEIKYGDQFKQVEYAYSLIQIDDFEYQTDKLLDILKSAPIQFDG